MNTPDTPKKATLDKRFTLALCIGLICGKTLSHLILHIQPWWLDLIVGGATTVVVTWLVLWIIGSFRRG